MGWIIIFFNKREEYYREFLKICDKKLRALAQIECDCVGDDRAQNNHSNGNNVNKNVVTNNEYFGSEDSNQFFLIFFAYEG